MSGAPHRRLKVMFLTGSYPTPESPVAGTFVREHARAAAQHCDVAVVHLDRTDGVRGLHGLERLAGEELPTWRARYRRSPKPLSYLALLWSAFSAYRSARRTLDPDVIHAHFFIAALPAVVIGLLYRKPVVVTEQWSIFLPEDPACLSTPMKLAARFAFRRAAVVMPVSNALREGISALGVAGPFRVVPNVVDEALFRPGSHRQAADPKRLLSVGLLYDAKGYDVLLDSVALLARERRDFRLDLVGDGPLRTELEGQASRLELDELVTFLGLKAKPEVAALMREADLFVLTSRFDSNPCVLIEAAASGLPIVATRVGGIPEIVGEHGVLAEPRDAESIAAAIAEALDRLGEFDRAAIAAGARARYGRAVVGAAFRAAYAEALGAV